MARLKVQKWAASSKLLRNIILMVFFSLLTSVLSSSSSENFHASRGLNGSALVDLRRRFISKIYEQQEQKRLEVVQSLTGNSSTVFNVRATAIHVDKAEFPLPKLLFKLALNVAERSIESKRFKLLLSVRSANTCSSQYAGAIAAEEYYLKKARLFIVSGCDDAIRGVSRLASGWRVPVMTAAGFGADLNDKTVYRTLIRVAFSMRTAVKFLIKILKSFLWQRVNLIVDESDPNSLSLKESIEKHLSEENNFEVKLNVISLNLEALLTSAHSNQSYLKSNLQDDLWPNETTERAVREALRQSTLYSRVSILLISQNYLRKFMLSVYDENMASGLYTFINMPLLLLASTQQAEAGLISQSEFSTAAELKQSYTSSIGENVFLWRSLKSTRNAQAKQAFESLMSIYLKTPTTKAYVYFAGKLLNLANSEFATTTTTESTFMYKNSSTNALATRTGRTQLNVNPYTAAFYDCLRIYAQALDQSLIMIDKEASVDTNTTNLINSTSEGNTRKSVRELHSRIVGLIKSRRFDNMATGSIVINENGDRETDYTLDDLNPMTGKFSPVILYKGDSKEIERLGRIHWSSDESVGPTVDDVDCALIGSCPRKPWSKFVVTLVLLSAPLSVIIGGALYFVYKQIHLESQLVDHWWRISYEEIELINYRRRQAGDGSIVGVTGNNSQVSIGAGKKQDNDCADSRAKDSLVMEGDAIRDSSNNHDRGRSESIPNEYTASITKATTNVSATAADLCYGDIRLALYKLNKVALKPISKFNQSRKLMIELRTIKNISHSNLCRFIGVVPEARPTMFLVSELCPKGSLREFFQNESMVIDLAFKYSIINDILAGLLYLHSSPLEFHGRLKSSNCLVSSRFVVKLSDYGLRSLYEQLDDSLSSGDNSDLMEKKIWLAPEHMKLSVYGKGGSIKGDVYSFGLLLYEILCNKIPFTVADSNDYLLPLRELYNELKNNGPSPDHTGPDLSLLDMEQNNMDALVELMKRSWSYEASKRPTMQEVNANLRRITKGVTSKKLLENLTSRMEQYTNNLESLVEAKLATLVEEKLKSEELLYQFVPKSVALLLKDGQSVEPEAFDCVTVFFSDIVGFTSLSSESSPMEVDTIGDAYIVASGLPQRNEGKHVIEIARAALELRQRISTFKIAHKPGRKLQMRVGINSGPCIAGIVGGTNMPKYCVFGDTLTTGKFMESSGLPMKIHLTEESKLLLDRVGGFSIEARVPKVNKDGLPIQTYWLESGVSNRL